ncbi:hypothetical protein SAMN04244553_4275 [Nocardia amikacinitolerans]|uniref:Uncharacterized protein n=1 Tax=Nocardia amikacinitolerans TaxID=756689 RepID=A0A285LVF4_9NOCA|nr:hypothetical protein SAMN04244553_4275 [Nocardia amikacinitolerans]
MLPSPRHRKHRLVTLSGRATAPGNRRQVIEIAGAPRCRAARALRRTEPTGRPFQSIAFGPRDPGDQPARHPADRFAAPSDCPSARAIGPPIRPRHRTAPSGRPIGLRRPSIESAPPVKSSHPSWLAGPEGAHPASCAAGRSHPATDRAHLPPRRRTAHPLAPPDRAIGACCRTAPAADREPHHPRAVGRATRPATGSTVPPHCGPRRAASDQGRAPG